MLARRYALAERLEQRRALQCERREQCVGVQRLRRAKADRLVPGEESRRAECRPTPRAIGSQSSGARRQGMGGRCRRGSDPARVRAAARARVDGRRRGRGRTRPASCPASSGRRSPQLRSRAGQRSGVALRDRDKPVEPRQLGAVPRAHDIGGAPPAGAARTRPKSRPRRATADRGQSVGDQARPPLRCRARRGPSRRARSPTGHGSPGCTRSPATGTMGARHPSSGVRRGRCVRRETRSARSLPGSGRASHWGSVDRRGRATGRCCRPARPRGRLPSARR